MHTDASTAAPLPDAARFAQLERDNAALTAKLKDAGAAYQRLRRAYQNALEQLQLLHHRLFVAKAERPNVRPEQLAFDAMFEQVKVLEKALEEEKSQLPKGDDAATPSGEKAHGNGDPKGKGRGSKGRRDLSKMQLPEVRVEVPDPLLEGKVERLGFEESSRLSYQRGGMRRVVVARVVYNDTRSDAVVPPASAGAAPSTDPDTMQTPKDPPTETATTQTQASPSTPGTSSKAVVETRFRTVTAPKPKELFRRGFLAPSMISHILVMKYGLGVPFYRQEKHYELQGVSLDRGTMCRYAEDAGATLGALVEAARKEALATAFCLSTDATGICVQPLPRADKASQPCKKGHFFVILADKDHVFFEYQEKHNGDVVKELFKGYSGYVQADAHSIYNALFREGTKTAEGIPVPPPKELGCWSHARRYFWEAAVCKLELGVEGLRRINVLFALDARLADLAPSQRKARREQFVRPPLEAFFEWIRSTLHDTSERGLVSSALGYALRHEQALRRFLEDGRLKMDNNASERALRTVAIGRKNWLFCGSDEHAQATGNLLSLLAGCRLHGLDPEQYLTELINVMPYWPRARYLELCPRYWAQTRARLDPDELAREIGFVTVPPPLPAEKKNPPH